MIGQHHATAVLYEHRSEYDNDDHDYHDPDLDDHDPDHDLDYHDPDLDLDDHDHGPDHDDCHEDHHDFSAAISNIHVDTTELITDDYDGIVILR